MLWSQTAWNQPLHNLRQEGSAGGCNSRKLRCQVGQLGESPEPKGGRREAAWVREEVQGMAGGTVRQERWPGNRT